MKKSNIMKKSNVINVTSPTFFVNKKDPRKVVYESTYLNEKEWKFVQVCWFGFDPRLKATDFLYVYEKDNTLKGFRGALLTPEHFKEKEVA
jgi:hypothetical protein